MSGKPYTEVLEPDHMGSADFQAVETEQAAGKNARSRWYVEGGMGKKVFGLVVVALVIGLFWYAYQRRLATEATDGSVTMDDSSPRVLQESTPNEPVEKKSVAPDRPTPPPVTVAAAAPLAVPASDSISPNPANGMVFSGSGKYQVYRQGNITWRVDTQSGKTCIVFATMEEWKKPIVYEHGCATS